ncbi:hypothetical protein ASF70_12735 [Rhizobium sp. Leaf321]|uniref:hypothetical protein n=1 Tax=Rhizobium sp. Leaf321 TaxID=1736335 RepID=UPI000713BD90|nr:hypothetical protein [Rhizobium sp. Leaf321]KQQ72394.1 hypothetical protein ASF70_12735 [Rhizobium sp. Leaf321]
MTTHEQKTIIASDPTVESLLEQSALLARVLAAKPDYIRDRAEPDMHLAIGFGRGEDLRPALMLLYKRNSRDVSDWTSPVKTWLKTEPTYSAVSRLLTHPTWISFIKKRQFNCALNKEEVQYPRAHSVRTRKEILAILRSEIDDLLSGIDGMSDEERLRDQEEQYGEVAFYFRGSLGKFPEIYLYVDGRPSDDIDVVSRQYTCNTWQETADYYRSSEALDRLEDIADEIIYRQARGQY